MFIKKREAKNAKTKCITAKAFTYLSTPVIITLLIKLTCLITITAKSK